MAAYQPIQMPQYQGSGLPEFFQQIMQQKAAQDAQRTDALFKRDQLAAHERESAAQNAIQQQQLEIQKQQAQQHQASAMAEARQAIGQAVDAGRIDVAKQIADSYKIPFEPKTVPGAPGHMPGQGDELMPPSQERPGFDKAKVMQNQVAASYTGGDTTDSEAISQARFEPAQPTPATPAKKLYAIAGQDYDPEEAIRAQETKRQRAVGVSREAFGGAGDKYATLAGSLAAAGVPPEKVAPIIAAEMEKDNSREATQANKQEDRAFRAEEDAKYRRSFAEAMALANANASGRVAAARVSAESPSKIDASAARDRALVGRTLNDADKVANLKGIVSSNDALHSAMSNIVSDNPLAHKDAQIQLARAIRGSIPTAAEEHMLYSGLGGILDKIPQGWAKLQTGDLSPEQLRLVQGAIKNVQHETSAQADKAYQSYMELGKDPSLQNLGPSINAGVRQRFARVGRDVPDVIQSAPGNQGTAILGAGRKAVNDRNAARVNTLKGTPDIKARAQQALNDPDATPAEKQRAQEILDR